MDSTFEFLHGYTFSKISNYRLLFFLLFSFLLSLSLSFFPKLARLSMLGSWTFTIGYINKVFPHIFPLFLFASLVVLLDLECKKLFLAFWSWDGGFKVIDKNPLRSFKCEHTKKIRWLLKNGCCSLGWLGWPLSRVCWNITFIWIQPWLI